MADIRRGAFLVAPHAGGTFSVFMAMRRALQSLGVQLRWVGFDDAMEAKGEWTGFAACGKALSASGKSRQARTDCLLTEVADEDLVFINVLTSAEEMTLAAWLPERVRRVMVVHSISRATLSAAKAIAPWVDGGVGVSPRVHHRLRRFMPRGWAWCIPNGLELERFPGRLAPTGDSHLRVLYLGRVSDMDKGVLWLPQILRQAPGATLTVAGDGPDLPELRRRCQGLPVEFTGTVGAANVPRLVESHDVLLMPSRFEGFGYALVEAMAGGCVPVASHIEGVTDFVVRDRQSGLLFPVGDLRRAAEQLRRLRDDRDLLARLAASAMKDARERFSWQAMADGYRPVLRLMTQGRPGRAPARPGQLLQFGGSWRRLVPAGVKNALRRYI